MLDIGTVVLREDEQSSKTAVMKEESRVEDEL